MDYATYFLDFMKEYWFQYHNKIVIACSGGPDSMFMVEMARQNDINIVVAHFNHWLRGNESDWDETFVKSYCDAYWIQFVSWYANIAEYASMKSIWVEEAAREKRYEFLESIRVENDASFILVGHHLDDSIETVFFNIIRWCKLNWITWIVEQNKYLLRPLSRLTKSEIVEWLDNNNIPYRIDSTNKENHYTRNKIRLDILPLVEWINPRYRNSMSSFMQYMKWMKSFIENQVLAFIPQWQDYFYQSDFEKLDPFLQREVIPYIYAYVNNGSTLGMTEWMVSEALKFSLNSNHNTDKEFKSLYLYNRMGKIHFCKV